MNTHYYTDLNDFSSQSKRNKKTTDRVLQCLPDNWSGQIPDLYCTTICGCSRIGGTEKCQNNDNNYNDYYATQCEFNLLLNNMHNICKVFTAFKINKLKKKSHISVLWDIWHHRFYATSRIYTERYQQTIATLSSVCQQISLRRR